MEVSGLVKFIAETESVGEKGFRKRDIVVTTDEQYPQQIQCQFVQDKCDLLDAVKIGESVKIGINLRGREWVNPQGESKYFNTIQGWRIEVVPMSGATSSPAAKASQEAEPILGEHEDDLPF
jgi:hypothetical protein